MAFDQAPFDLRCEWGRSGVAQLATISDVIIIVDVLSFSTAIDIALGRGAVVFPYRWKDASAQEFAKALGAELAGSRDVDRYSLSPSSLQQMAAGTQLVLPSPNGSSLSLATGATPTLTGCFRNCRAVAEAAQTYGSRITVIPAGEQWADQSLRPAIEDWLGAGAILSYLPGLRSPEAEMAIAAFQEAQPQLTPLMQRCGSGRELIERGFEADITLATAFNVSHQVPTLDPFGQSERAYRAG